MSADAFADPVLEAEYVELRHDLECSLVVQQLATDVTHSVVKPAQATLNEWVGTQAAAHYAALRRFHDPDGARRLVNDTVRGALRAWIDVLDEHEPVQITESGA